MYNIIIINIILSSGVPQGSVLGPILKYIIRISMCSLHNIIQGYLTCIAVINIIWAGLYGWHTV